MKENHRERKSALRISRGICILHAPAGEDPVESGKPSKPAGPADAKVRIDRGLRRAQALSAKPLNSFE